MAAAIPIVVQAIAAVAISSIGIASGSFLGALILGGATLLGGFIANELFGGRDDLSQHRDQTAIRANYVSTEKTIPIIYGERLVGSNDVFAEIGSRGQAPPDNKKYLWVVHVLGEGVCEGIAQEEVEGVLWDKIYVDSKPIWEYEEGVITYWFYNGTDSQLNNYYINHGTREDSEEKFTDALRNVAYIVFRFKYEESVFLGVPAREIVLRGIRILDVRDDVVKWSRNPALILYDYLTNTRYGTGWSNSILDTQSWREAADYCDAVGWEINYVVGSQLRSQTIIDSILGHFRGALYWFDDLLHLRFMDLRGWESPVFSIEDKHIARDSSKKALVSVGQPSRFNIPDGVTIEYINSRDNWVTDRINVGDREGQIKPLDFPGFTDRNLALEMGTYVLERQRLNRVFNFTLRGDTVALDVNDLIYLNSSEINVWGQLARVKNNVITSAGLIQVSAVLESESLYDLEFDPDTSEIYNVYFPAITDPPPPVENAYVTEETYYYRERTFVRLNVFFIPPQRYPWFSHVDVYVGFPDPISGEPPLEGEYLYKFPASDDFQLDPVEEGQRYYIRLNAVSIHGARQNNFDAFILVHTVKGVSEEYPPCPTYLRTVINVSSVDLISYVPFSPDIAGYEIRLGQEWASSIFITYRSHPSISFNGIKPGSHKLWLNTKHTNGVYCQDPVFDVASLIDPPIGSLQFYDEVVLYETTVPGNMIAEGTYPSQTLRCAHYNGVLSGEFVSQEMDTRSLPPQDDMLIYVLFDFYQIGGPTTWDALAPLGATTWWDFAYDPVLSSWKTWYESFGDYRRLPAAKLEVSIDYSVTSGGPYDTVERLELLTAVLPHGRYIRVRYKITDINLSSYIVLGPSTVKAANIV